MPVEYRHAMGELGVHNERWYVVYDGHQETWNSTCGH